MRQILRLGIVAAGLLTGAPVIQAQTQSPPQPSRFKAQHPQIVPTPPFRQSAIANPTMSILGLPAGISAPVALPYCEYCAFRNFGGQPMRGQDQFIAPSTGD